MYYNTHTTNSCDYQCENKLYISLRLHHMCLLFSLASSSFLMFLLLIFVYSDVQADGIREGCDVLRFGLLHENIQPRFDAFSVR